MIQKSEGVYACIVSQHDQLRLKPDFDLLMNRGNGAKVEWKVWEKLIPFTQGFDGAVSTISGGSRVRLFLLLFIHTYTIHTLLFSLKFIMLLGTRSITQSDTMILIMQLVSLLSFFVVFFPKYCTNFRLV